MLLYILFSFAQIVTMSIPINLDGLIYDFRSIPLAIGSLYGGINFLIELDAISQRCCHAAEFIFKNKAMLNLNVDFLPKEKRPL
ncbi:hypothetical protein HQN89_32450 [Paenibacillus frigoriresistens]|nr:hypothetical protein [Paenibacillus frigoriresistens]